MALYTTSFAFFEALWEAGVRYVFESGIVNLGSDHPSIIEAIVKGKHEKHGNFPEIITCPNEMVAMSMADGYARYSGMPQCVIVHVDVGTQGLGAAVHNASTGRAPVLIFAGLSPYSIDGQLRGSRTEYIHWVQDVPDQKQILAQYCRYTGEIKTGTNVKELVNRALSFAMSDPKGPVYLYGAREAMEQEITPYTLDQRYWRPLESGLLSPATVTVISDSLSAATAPLVLTGYAGRNPEFCSALEEMANLIPSLRVIDTGGSDMCFPANHPAWRSVRFGVAAEIEKADIILVIDCDVPWIDSRCKPMDSAKVYHIDVDPLKQQMPVFYINALLRIKADAATAVLQLNDRLRQTSLDQLPDYDAIARIRQEEHAAFIANIKAMAKPNDDGTFSSSLLCALLKSLCPSHTIWVIEAVTQTQAVADAIQATLPGSWFNCGGGGLGWSGGAALGIHLAAEAAATTNSKGSVPSPFICQIVGDGTYMFTIPSSVYWISQRYSIPILTVVLNNNGWNAPKNSLLLVHPDGPASRASRADMGILFDPTPDYAGIAKAASGGNIEALHVGRAEDLPKVIELAVKTVQNGTSAVIDAHLGGSDGKYLPPRVSTKS